MSTVRLERANLAVGLVLWLGLLVVWRPHPMTPVWPLLLVMFGAWVVTPMARVVFWKHFTPQMPVSSEWSARLQIPSAVGLAASVLIAQGLPAAVLAGPWLLTTLCMGYEGLKLFGKSEATLAQRLALIGWMQLPVGGAWLFADRMALEPFGFDGQIVRLTAAHFHFAGLVLPLMAGLILQHLRQRWIRVACVGASGGVLLVALGISITKWGAPVEMECLLASAFCILVLSVALAQGLVAWRLSNFWLGASAFSLLFGMMLALFYALRIWLPLPWLHIPWMWAVHGSVQVFGFTIGGLVGWWRQPAIRP